MKRLFILILVLFGLLLTSCVMNQPQNTQNKQFYPTSRTIEKPFNKIWTDTITTLTSKGFVIQLLEKDSGLIITKELNYGFNQWGTETKYIVMPQGFLAVYDNIKIQYQFVFTSIDSTRTMVNVKGNYSIYESNVARGWYQVGSTGLAESNLLDAIERN